jgi:hypothetical protein
MNNLTDCQFPSVAAPYANALRAATAYILDAFRPHAIVACGTIIRGNPGPTSDLDLYVIHDQPWRQRVQKFFAGVPAEIFVNPPPRIERYFAEERASGRPMTAHMLATGYIMLDRQGEAARLKELARQVLRQPPDPTGDALMWQRYGTALVYEDAVDIAEIDPENARLLLGKAVQDMLDYAYLNANRNIPRQQEIITGLAALNPELERLTRAFFQTTAIAEQVDLAGRIADLTLGARGFFEWESARNAD